MTHEEPVDEGGVRTWEEAFGDAGPDGPTDEELAAVLEHDDVFLGVYTVEELAALHSLIEVEEPLAAFDAPAAAIDARAGDHDAVDAALRSLAARGLAVFSESDPQDDFLGVEIRGPLAVIAQSRLGPPLVNLIEIEEKGGETAALTAYHLDEDVVLEEATDDDGFHAFVLRDVLGEAVALANMLDPDREALDDGEPKEHSGDGAERELKRLKAGSEAALVVHTVADLDDDTVTESIATFFAGPNGVTVVSGYDLDGATTVVTAELSATSFLDLLVDALLGMPDSDDDAPADDGAPG